jgi:hypothetical protein
MQVTYKNTKDDFIKAVKLYYFNSFLKISMIFILLYACIFMFNKEKELFFNVFLSIIFLFIIIVFLVNIKRFKQNLNKLTEGKSNNSFEESLNLTEEGFSILPNNSNDEKIFTWSSIKSTFQNNKYYLILLQNEKFVLINKTNAEQSSKLPDVIGKIEQNKNTKTNTKNNKSLYFLGFFGLIPNLGLIVGVILSIIGIIKKDLKLIIIGILDIFITILFWFVLNKIEHSEMIKNPINNKLSEVTKSNLNDLVLRIENYKTLKGEYPDNLKQIDNKNSFIFINEIFEDDKNTELYYKKINKTFILKSYGPDKVINTKDDIEPDYSR